MATLLYHDVAPSGEDFTSLDAAIDHLVASHANFVTADVYGEIEIKGDWSSAADTAAVTINGLTLDATRYLHVYTNASNRAKASGWDDNLWALSVSNSVALLVQDDHTKFDGLQVEVAAWNANAQHVLYVASVGSSSTCQVSNCRMRGTSTASTYAQTVFRFEDADLTTTAWNIIVERVSTHAGGYGVYISSATSNFYNCLAYGGTKAWYRVAGTVNVYDSVAFNSGNDFDGTFNTIDYCASDDNDGTNNVAESGGGAAWPSDFTDAANGNFTLLVGSALRNSAGAAGSGTFSTDIDGQTRSDWDVGPDEYVSSGYTLDCNGGSYAVTGTAMTPKRDGKVAADGGSYTLTGGAAGAYYGRAVDADAGAYSITGAAASLLRAAKIVPEAGAYVLTGAEAAALYGRAIDADAGTYVVTGSEAALLRAARLAAEVGAYVLSGQDAAIILGRLLSAEAGAYVVTGQDVTLVYTPGGGAYVITAEGGTYSITGAAATILAAHKITPEAGAYIITGQDAAVLLGRLLDAGSGTYALSGDIAALLRGAKIAADAGSYVLAGQIASLIFGGEITAILKRWDGSGWIKINLT